MANSQALQRQGWYLTTDGIEECVENGKNRVDDIIRVALDLDLKDIGERHLQEGITKGKVEFVDGPFVVQIQKIRNVSAPKDNEESQGAPKLFKLVVSDGHSSCTALEMENISNLGLNTPPGTKIKLLGKVPVNHGFLLLNSSNCKILGGHVDKLVENWELKRSLAKHSRTNVGGEGGAPPFVPFGQRRRNEDPGNYTRRERDNFKSLDTGKEKKEGDTEFEQQRQATIAEALQAKEDGKEKKFGPGGTKQNDADVARIVEMGFTPEQAGLALRQNNGNVQQAIDALLNKDSNPRWTGRGPPRDGGKDFRGDKAPPQDRERPERGRGRRQKSEEDEELDSSSKPSAPATLFDFLTNKIPAKEGKGKGDGGNKRADASATAAAIADDDAKRGHPNLPPRLIKAQQRREEERQYRDRTRGPPPGQSEKDSEDYGGPPDKKSYDRGDRQSNNRGQSSRGRGYDQSSRKYDGSYEQGGRYQDSRHYDRGYDQNSKQYEGRRHEQGGRDHGQGGKPYQGGNRKYDQNDRYDQDRYGGQGPRRDDYQSGKGRGGRGGYSNQDDRGYSRDQQRDSGRKGYEGGRGQRSNDSGDYRSDRYSDGRYSDSRGDARDRGGDSQRGRNQNTRDDRGGSNWQNKPQRNESDRSGGKRDQQQQQHQSGQSRGKVNQDRSRHANGTGTGQPMVQQSAPPPQYTPPAQGPPQAATHYVPTTGHIVQQMQNLQIASSSAGQMQGAYSQGDQQYVAVQQGYPSSSGIVQYSANSQVQYTNSNVAQSGAHQKQYNGKQRHQWKAQDYCLARYWEDNKFYRAMINSASPGGQSYLVTFTDYGNTEEVAINDIKPLHKQSWDQNSMTQQPVVVSQMPTNPVTMANVSASVPGILVPQPPPNMPYVSAFPTDQPYQGNIGSMEFRQTSPYYQPHPQQKNVQGQRIYVPNNQGQM